MPSPENPDTPDNAAERTAALAAVEPLLRKHYIFPEVVDRVVAAMPPPGPEDDQPEAWAVAVTEALQSSSGDLHLRMHWSANVLDQADVFVDAPPTPAELADRQRYARREARGVTAVERLDGNVGYLKMREFIEPAVSGAYLAAAMTLLAGTDALLVDLRYSRGGSPAAVQFLCSHFFDPHRDPVHLNDIVEGSSRTTQFWTQAWLPSPHYLDRPVYILTSARTFSAAEEFAYNMQATGRGTLVGVRTRGGAHPSTRVPVTEHFSLNLPIARSVNPITGTNWEGTGITPDIAVDEDDAYPVAYRAALQEVIAGPAIDEEVRAEARRALTTLGG